VAASYWGRILSRPGAYRAFPWAHLVGLVVLVVLALMVARRTAGHRKIRRFAAFVGVAVAIVSAAVLWGFVFVGSRLPDLAAPNLLLAPPMALPGDRGEVVRITRLLERGPVVVTFFRGAFDGWSRAALADLEAVHRRGVAVVAVSGDGRGELAGLKRQLGLGFPLLSDPDLAAARAWGVLDEDTGTPHPSVFVVAPDGRVAWVYVSSSLRDLPGPDRIVERVMESRAAPATPAP
jgi:mycoredoxin-dependent peroxiredoxin